MFSSNTSSQELRLPLSLASYKMVNSQNMKWKCKPQTQDWWTQNCCNHQPLKHSCPSVSELSYLSTSPDSLWIFLSQFLPLIFSSLPSPSPPCLPFSSPPFLPTFLPSSLFLSQSFLSLSIGLMRSGEIRRLTGEKRRCKQEEEEKKDGRTGKERVNSNFLKFPKVI